MYSTSGRAVLAASLHGVGAVLGDEVGRVQALRDDHHHRLHRGELLLERERTLGGSCARLVGVERQDRALGEPAELAEVPLPQRRAARGDRVLDAGLHQPDHVGVALDHEHLAARGHRLTRAMQVVEHLVLLVDRRLGGVEVLGLLARTRIGGQDASAEPDPPALQVVDGEGHPAAEPVADLAVVTAGGQPRLQQDLGAEVARPAEPPQQEVADSRARTRRRTSRATRARCRARHVLACVGGLLAFGEHPGELLGGLLVRPVQRVLAGGGPPCLGRVALVPEETPACWARRSTAST